MVYHTISQSKLSGLVGPAISVALPSEDSGLEVNIL